jgi:pyruvate decarboxylase
MSRPLSCSQALLNEIEPRDPSTWTDALDTVLKDVLEQCRPGYVEIPTDAVHHKVSADGLKKLLVCIIPLLFSSYRAGLLRCID